MKNWYHDGVTQKASLGYHLHQHYRKEDLPLKTVFFTVTLPLLYRRYRRFWGWGYRTVLKPPRGKIAA